MREIDYDPFKSMRAFREFWKYVEFWQRSPVDPDWIKQLVGLLTVMVNNESELKKNQSANKAMWDTAVQVFKEFDERLQRLEGRAQALALRESWKASDKLKAKQKGSNRNRVTDQ